MTKIEAIKGSIKKWAYLSFTKKSILGIPSCALCVYNNDTCTNCPLFHHWGVDCNHSTSLYDHWYLIPLYDERSKPLAKQILFDLICILSQELKNAKIDTAKKLPKS